MQTPSHTSFPLYIDISTYPSPSAKLILLLHLLCTFFSFSACIHARVSPVINFPYPLSASYHLYAYQASGKKYFASTLWFLLRVHLENLPSVFFLISQESLFSWAFHLEMLFPKLLLPLFLSSLLLPLWPFLLGLLH